MSVIIKDMGMPACCAECPFCRVAKAFQGDKFYCWNLKAYIGMELGMTRRPDRCPLRPAPEGYIDGNKLFSRISGHSYYHGDSILSAIQCAIDGKESSEPIQPTDMRPAPEWHDAKSDPPKPFVSVQLYVPDYEPLPQVMEGYIDDVGRYHAVRMGVGIVEATHWNQMSNPPKEETT